MATMATKVFAVGTSALDTSTYNAQRHIDDYSITEAELLGPKAQKMCEAAFVSTGLGEVTGLVVAHKHFKLSEDECLVTYKQADVMQPLANRVESRHADLLPIMFILTNIDNSFKVMPVLFVHEAEFPEVQSMLQRLEAQSQRILSALKDEAESQHVPVETFGISLNIHPMKPDGKEGFTLVEVTDESARTQTFKFEPLKKTPAEAGALYSTVDDVPIPRMLPVIWKQVEGEERVGSCVTCGCCCLDD